MGRALLLLAIVLTGRLFVQSGIDTQSEPPQSAIIDMTQSGMSHISDTPHTRAGLSPCRLHPLNTRGNVHNAAPPLLPVRRLPGISER